MLTRLPLAAKVTELVFFRLGGLGHRLGSASALPWLLGLLWACDCVGCAGLPSLPPRPSWPLPAATTEEVKRGRAEDRAVGEPQRELLMVSVSVGGLQRFGRKCDAGDCRVERQQDMLREPDDRIAVVIVESLRGQAKQFGVAVAPDGSAPAILSPVEDSFAIAPSLADAATESTGAESFFQFGTESAIEESAPPEGSGFNRSAVEPAATVDAITTTSTAPSSLVMSSSPGSTPMIEPMLSAAGGAEVENSSAAGDDDDVANRLLMPQLPMLAKLSVRDPGKLSFGSVQGSGVDAASSGSAVRDGNISGGHGFDRPTSSEIADEAEVGLGSLLPPRGSDVWWWICGSLLTGVLGCLCLAAGCVKSMQADLPEPLGAGRLGGELREAVALLPRCSGAEVEKKMPHTGGYDCSFAKPISSKMVLRLEAQVLATDGGLVSPLTRRRCVLYTTAVSHRLHDGLPPAPVAFHSASCNFSVQLLDAQHIRILICGQDVSFFSMAAGRYSSRAALGSAPEHWQDFVHLHRASASIGDARANLEFEECALLTGATVTVVGELHRGPDRLLTLRPWQPCELLHLGLAEDDEVAAVSLRPLVAGRVFVSDDTSLVPSEQQANPHLLHIGLAEKCVSRWSGFTKPCTLFERWRVSRSAG